VLIAIPGTSVIGGVFMIYLSMTGSDYLVKDSYYKDGMAINRQLDRDRHAADLGIEANVTFQAADGDILVALPPGADEYALEVELFHPTDKTRDMRSTLFRLKDDNEKYRGSFGAPLEGRWYVELRDKENDWRLRGQVILPANAEIVMRPMKL
jgi:hypothetical protein